MVGRDRDPHHSKADGDARGLSLPQRARNHMRNVYGTLAVGSGFVTVGVFLQMWFHIGGLLSLVAMIGLSVYFHSVVNARQDERSAYLAYYAASAGLGINLGPLVQMGVAMDPSIVVAASGASLAIFGGFTVASLLTPQRYLLYLGGIISSFSMLFLFKFIVMLLFGGSMFPMLYHPFLYIGLLMGGAYVMYDTERMITRALSRDRLDGFDVLRDSYELLLDLIMLFRRILVILMESQGNNNGNRRNGRRENKRQGGGFGGTSRR